VAALPGKIVCTPTSARWPQPAADGDDASGETVDGEELHERHSPTGCRILRAASRRALNSHPLLIRLHAIVTTGRVTTPVGPRALPVQPD
jgi:hypothetical protein